MAFSLGTAEGRLVIDGSGAKAGFAVAQAAAESFFGVLKDKVNTVQEVGDKLTKFGLAGVAGFGVAVGAAANFEQKMSAISAVSGATGKDFDALRDKALQLGKDTSFSASEAADAMGELAKAGVGVPDILNGAADATVALAAAGEIALPQAAEIAAAAMNNFSIKGSELPHVADLIAGAANASAISVEDFGNSLTQVGAVANLVGVSFDDTAVAIAEMGNAGIKGSDAGTSLKSMLSNLIPQTEQQTQLFQQMGLQTFSAQGAMDALAKNGIKPVGTSLDDIKQSVGTYLNATQGIPDDTIEMKNAVDKWLISNGGMQNAFFDTTGKIKPLRDIQDILSKSTADMTQEQKLNTLGILFGSDAIRAAAVMSKQGAEGYDKLASSMGKISAADVAKTRLDNLKGSIEQIKGSFETVAIEVGSVLLPALKHIVDAVNGLIGKFLNLPEGVKKAIYIFAAVATAASLLGGVLISLAVAAIGAIGPFLAMFAIRSVVGIFVSFFGALLSGAGPMAAIGAAGLKILGVFNRVKLVVTILTTVVRGLGAAWVFATGPVGIAIAIVLALAAAFYIAYQRSETFRNIVNSVASAVKGFLQPAIDGVKAGLQALVDGFNGTASGASGFLGFLQMVGGAVGTFVGVLQQLYGWFKAQIIPVLQEVGSMLQSALGSALTQISGVITSTIVPALQNFWAQLQALGPSLQQLWTTIQPLVMILGGALLGALIAVMAIIVAVIAVVLALIPPIIAFGAAIVNTIINVVVAAFNLLAGVISGVLNVVMGIINVFIGVLTGNWGMAWDGIKQIVMGAWQIIESIFVGAFNILLALVTGFGAAFGAFFSTLWGEIGGYVTAGWNAIVGFFQGGQGTTIGNLEAWGQGVQDKFQAHMAAAGDNVSRNWGNITSSFSNGYNSVNSSLDSWGNSMAAKVQGFMSDMGSKISSGVSTAISWLAGMASRAAGALSGLGSTISGVASAAMSAMGSAISSGIGRAVGALRGVASAAAGAVGNLGGVLVRAGGALLDGLVSGIRGAIGKVKSVLNSVTGLIPSWKGPMDVDKKLLTPNGEAIMQGLLKGISKQTPALKKQLQALMPAMQASITPMAAPGDPRAVQAMGLRLSQLQAQMQATGNAAKQQTFQFNAYGADASQASDVQARRMRAMATMGAF